MLSALAGVILSKSWWSLLFPQTLNSRLHVWTYIVFSVLRLAALTADMATKFSHHWISEGLLATALLLIISFTLNAFRDINIENT